MRREKEKEREKEGGRKGERGGGGKERGRDRDRQRQREKEHGQSERSVQVYVLRKSEALARTGNSRHAGPAGAVGNCEKGFQTTVLQG